MSDFALVRADDVMRTTRLLRKIAVVGVIGGIVAGAILWGHLAPGDLPHIDPPDHVPAMFQLPAAVTSPAEIQLGGGR